MKDPKKALPWIRRSAVHAMCILTLAAAGAGGAWAATLKVTTLDDSGPGSLRQAIADAAAGDTIVFKLRPNHRRWFYQWHPVHGTIALTSGALIINKNLTIEGPGSPHLKISGNHASRVFVIFPDALGNPVTVTLAGMKISDGLADGNAPPYPIGLDTRSVGGAILNLSGLVLSDVVLSGNRAIGDDSTAPLGYPGSAWGGAVANAGMLAVNNSAFIGNLARGADGIDTLGSDPPAPAGFTGGGAIFNAGILRINHSRFTRNHAIGGNDNSSIFFPGHAFGGAIVSASSDSASGDMVVQHSAFSHNQAIGGDANISPPVVPADFGANKATGGAINVAGGTATIDRCTFMHNRSIGGAGDSGAADGGTGAGGAVMVTNVSGFGTEAVVSNSKIKYNMALGGPGSDDGAGGNGQGGGLISAAAGILTVIDTTVAYNHAQGGPGGDGGDGGDGLGGGLYDQYNHPEPPPPFGDTVLELQGAIVTRNLASGGEAGSGGSEGEGIGGGVYHLGTYSADSKTIIKKNQATTSNDNVGP